MCVESLNTLRDHGLINMDEGFDLKPTGMNILLIDSLITSSIMLTLLPT